MPVPLTQIVEGPALAQQEHVGLQGNLEIIPMPVDQQIGDGIHCQVLRRMDVMYIPVQEENQAEKQLLHDLVNGVLIAIQVTAVATCTVVHQKPP